MLFNSHIYIFVFLPLTVILYFFLNRLEKKTSARLLLVSASLFFYSYWNPAYLPVILISLLVNYAIGNKKSGITKKLLVFGIVFNLSLLGYFKYADFLIENYNTITSQDVSLLKLTLPLAISFFTFQQIAFLVDRYKNKAEKINFLNYSLFVTFFPQLIAGPIVHHSEMMPQFKDKNKSSVNWRNIYLGLFIFSFGLFKKAVVADTFSVWANLGYSSVQSLNFIEAWLTSLSYTFQIYYDFSGYTDMAIGSALFFNIRLPENFNSPYKALNIQEFWRRWHMTLSRWLRDYIFIPLGGSRVKISKTCVNIFITFLLGGIWHGAGWTFVIWGAMHGAACTVHRYWDYFGLKLYWLFSWLITFLFLNFTWVFFRAENMETALSLTGKMFGASEVVLPQRLKIDFLKNMGVKFDQYFIPNISLSGMKILFWTVIVFFISVLMKNSTELLEKTELKNNKKDYLKVFFGAVVFTVAVLHLTQESEFLYFNF